MTATLPKATPLSALSPREPGTGESGEALAIVGVAVKVRIRARVGFGALRTVESSETLALVGPLLAHAVAVAAAGADVDDAGRYVVFGVDGVGVAVPGTRECKRRESGVKETLLQSSQSLTAKR